MNIGLNRERSIGLNILKNKILECYEKDLTRYVDAINYLNEYIGIRPITDLETAQRLAKPVKASAAFHISSKIYQDLVEHHNNLVSNTKDTESAFAFTLDKYQPDEKTGLVFGRFPKVLRDATSDGTQQGQDRILEAISLEGIPLARIVNLTRREAVNFPHEIRGNFFGHFIYNSLYYYRNLFRNNLQR